MACFQRRDKYMDHAHDASGATLNKIDSIPGVENDNDNNNENGTHNADGDR